MYVCRYFTNSHSTWGLKSYFFLDILNRQNNGDKGKPEKSLLYETSLLKIIIIDLYHINPLITILISRTYLLLLFA